tara:strand:+ start:659 stop:844 length:186 start_codon:yes stop_codon:yes gene_type:complete
MMKNQNDLRSEADLKFVLLMTLIFFIIPLIIIFIPGIDIIGDSIVKFMMNAIDTFDLSQPK